MKLDMLVERLQMHDLKASMQLNACTYIPNLEVAVNAHIRILKANSGNRRYKVYYDRLREILQILETK